MDDNSKLMFGSGLVLGYVMSGKSSLFNFLITVYIMSIWGSRSAATFILNSIEFRKQYLTFFPHEKELTTFFDDATISFEYNWWHNTLTIKRNFVAKWTYDSDKIEYCFKKLLNMIFCWDAFYQFRPLKVILA